MTDYTNLHEQLTQQFTWPRPYLFKFIVPSNSQSIALTQALFDETAEIAMRESKTGKYTSISAKQVMLNPDEVIAKYKKASTIEGLMSL